MSMSQFRYRIVLFYQVVLKIVAGEKIVTNYSTILKKIKNRNYREIGVCAQCE